MPLLATDIKASTPKNPFLAIHSKAQQHNSSSCDTGLLLIRRDDSQHHMPLLATDINFCSDSHTNIMLENNVSVFKKFCFKF